MQLFDGLLMNKPEHTRLTEHGQMHEGEASTRLGMKGIPSLAEEVMVTRDLQLLAYTGGRIHFSLLSTAAAIEAVRQAKAAGLAVTCDVASYQAAFTDDTLVPFDTNYKVAPPFGTGPMQRPSGRGCRTAPSTPLFRRTCRTTQRQRS